jgi:DNA polymerase III delta subunit
LSKVLHVKGPADAGAGERQEMLERANAFFRQHSVAPEDVVRVDVPGRGGSEGSIEGTSLRHELEPLIPALQSTSLFGNASGAEVVDAQNLLAGEAATIADLLAALDPDGTVAAVVLSAGAVAAALAKAVRGQSVTVKKMRERDAAGWLGRAAAERGVEIEPPGAAALVQRFGSDVAALGQALDQLASSGTRVTRQEVLDRFRNRPDEPMWHYSDAVAAGKTGDALRRLADFLTHGHPLQLLGFLEADLRRRAIAAAAPDQATLADTLQTNVDDYRVARAWRERRATSDTDLQKALSALHRADRILKTEPEDVHRITMERLTVALSRWYRK